MNGIYLYFVHKYLSSRRYWDFNPYPDQCNFQAYIKPLALELILGERNTFLADYADSRSDRTFCAVLSGFYTVRKNPIRSNNQPNS